MVMRKVSLGIVILLAVQGELRGQRDRRDRSTDGDGEVADVVILNLQGGQRGHGWLLQREHKREEQGWKEPAAGAR